MFASEKHNARSFYLSWSHRKEPAQAIARRVAEMTEGLAKLDLGFDDLWPILDENEADNPFDAHAGRFEGLPPEELRKLYDELVASGDLPGPSIDFGPVLGMHIEGLADLIDTRVRFDAPLPPRPVSGGGYFFFLASEPPEEAPRDDLWAHVQLHVGRHSGASFNDVRLQLHNKNPLWRDVDRAIEVLRLLVQAWDAETAAASGFVVPQPSLAEEDPPSYHRPWLAWQKEAGRKWPVAQYGVAEPWPFPFERAGPAERVLHELGGELRIWP